MAFDLNKIEDKIDKVITGAIELNDEGAGIAIKRLVDAMEVAKLMSLAGPAIPSFMRGNPGLCYSAVVRGVRWGIDPFFVAEHSYLVNNRGEEKVAFDAQLIIAVINAHAPLQKMMWATYRGEGLDMVCTVHALPRGQTDAIELETPTLGKLIESRGRNDYGKIKGSQLYDTDPKQQMLYYGKRNLCRAHFPHVLAGVYDKDEFEPVDGPKDVTPQKDTLSNRLKAQRKLASPRGFSAASIDTTLSNAGATASDDPSSSASGSSAASIDSTPVAVDAAISITSPSEASQ
jgi:hypothetical protein